MMTAKQRARYRVLVGYGLTRKQAREALGLDEVWVPATPKPEEPEPAPVPAAAPSIFEPLPEVTREWPYPRHLLTDLPLPAPTRAVVGYEDAPRWRSICERVADPVVALRRGGGVPVR